jgi:hypothetical protein
MDQVCPDDDVLDAMLQQTESFDTGTQEIPFGAQQTGGSSVLSGMFS